MFNFIKKLTHQETPKEKFNRLFDKAQELTENKKFKEAIPVLNEIIENFPTNIQPMGELCNCLCELKDYNKVIEIATKALSIAQKRANRDNIGRFYGYIGHAYKETKKFQQAIKYFLLAIANKPYYLNNHYELSICYNNLNDYEKSAKIYEDIIAKDADYAKSMDIYNMLTMALEEYNKQIPEKQHIDLGDKYKKNEQKEKAFSEYMKAYEANPKSTRALFEIFTYKNERNETEEAIRYGVLTYTSTFNNDNIYNSTYLMPYIFYNLAEIFKKQNDNHNYEKCTLLLKYYALLCEAEDLKKNKKDYDPVQVAVYYQQAVDFYPELYEAFDKLIPMQISFGMYPEAMENLKKAFALAQKRKNNEKMSSYFHQASICFSCMKKYDKAIEFAINSVKTTQKLNKKLSFNFDLALCYEYDNNYKECLNQLVICKQLINEGTEDEIDIESEIIRIKEIMDKNSDINKAKEFYKKACKLLDKKRLEEAKNNFEQSLELIPQDITVMEQYINCLRSLNKTAEALKIASEAFLVCKQTHDYDIDIFATQLAFISLDLKDFKAALNFSILATSYNPKNCINHSLIGMSYYNLGEYAKAITAFYKAYQINPREEFMQKINECQSMMQKR